MIRALGGVLYLTGALIMVYNLWKTVTHSEPVRQPAPAWRPQAAE